MTWRGTIGLGLVLGALAAALWWSAPSGPTAPAPSGPPLLSPHHEVSAVEIHAAGVGRRFELVDDGWSDRDGAAAPEGLTALLGALRTLSPVMVVDEDPDAPGEFGLGSDAVRLVAIAGDATVLDLDVGARNPAWTSVYVRRHGARAIEMVGALLLWELAKVLDPSATGKSLTKRRETREPSSSRPAKEAP